MGKMNLRETNPELYAALKEEQAKLRYDTLKVALMARICPYCQHVSEYLACGVHDRSVQKCRKCGEEIVFPAVYFRISMPALASR